MSTTGFIRLPRIAPPRPPGGEVAVTAPPEVPRPVAMALLLRMLPFVMVIAMVGMMALMITVGGAAILSNPLSLMFPMMMLMSMVGMFVGMGRRTKGAGELDEERKDYGRYLNQLRNDVRKTGVAQRESLEWSHPAPEDLLPVVGSRRMWERRPKDPDFGHVRLGTGSHRLATRLARPETGPVEDLEPVSVVALRRFLRTHSVVHRLPTAVSLRAFPAISIEGPADRTAMLVRGMLMELCTFHGPDHLAVAIVCTDPDSGSWAWTKWLPHIQHSSVRDGMGSGRMIYPSLVELEAALNADLVERGRFLRNAEADGSRVHLVIVIGDGHTSGTERTVSDPGLDGVTVIDMQARPESLAMRRGLRLVMADGMIAARSTVGVEKFATPDRVSVSEATAFARQLSRYRIATAAQIVRLGDDVRTDPGLMSLLKIPDAAEIVPAQVWRPRSSRERLRVPIGVAPDGTPVEIDIKESAEYGMGPHGLCIGATGSGKSEFLRTLVLALVTTHSPEALNMVLVDFKGGATFAGLEPLAHVAAVITNLEQDLSMVDRMKDALSGEMNRRQELLRAAGNFANVTDYERARVGGAALQPLPALFVIVDEFSELLAQKPDFADLFVMIGRLGRSLHVHLLLASQRLEENRLRGLDSHLSYRIGLRTFSASESRTVLGITDAYHLPSVPGSAYLKSDADEPIRFNSTYVSGPYSAGDTGSLGVGRWVGGRSPVVFTASPVPVTEEPAGVHAAQSISREQPESSAMPPTLLAVVVGRLSGYGSPAHAVWLPPLDDSPAIDLLLPEPDWRAAGNRRGNLRWPIGIIDKPYDQRRDVLIVDLAGAQGNVAVVGGPQSGKSTALRTMIVAAAATHTPEQVQFYCLDFGGGALSSVAEVPHVGSVAGRLEADRVRRTIAEVVTVMRRRERRFGELGIVSMAEYRRRRDSTDPFGDVFLVIDGWSAFCAEFEVLEPTVTALAAQGLSYGVHVMLSASRWMEIRPVVKDQIGTRVELRLGDPSDSEMGRIAASAVPMGRPGRGLTAEQLHMLIALPRLDGRTDADTLPDGLAAARSGLYDLYPNHRVPQVRMLPSKLSYAEILESVPDPRPRLDHTNVAVGLGESELQPVILDFAAQPHLLIFGDVECGKTTLLRSIVTGVVGRATPEQARVVLIDYRRTMLGVIEGQHLAGYSSASQTARAMTKEVATYLQRRIPGSDITPRQLRERSWWTGPEIFVVVDDYDMVARATTNPLLELVEFFPQGRDIGLHLIIARRAGGAARALFDPVLGALKDLSTDGILMSTPKDEGILLGDVKPSQLPPGRGVFISRSRGREMIQTVYLPPL